VTPLQEIEERGRRNVENAKRLNANICIGIGVLFVVFAVLCFIGAIGLIALASRAQTEVNGGGGLAIGSALAVLVFGLFWGALAALLIWLGKRGLRGIARGQRLRATGVRGHATVLSYTESNLKVDGATNWQVAVRVALAGRPPWDMNLNVPVVRGEGGRIYTGATLPVLIDPADPSEVMVDFDAR